MKIKDLKNNKGYTIIETMIAVSLFLVIVTIATGALLNANLVHQKSQNMRSIIDNLSFIMEDMSRNLRTGYAYNCGDVNVENPTDCPSGGSILYFEEANGKKANSSDQWGYSIGDGFIDKTTDGGLSWMTLTPSEVYIDQGLSSFIVTGTKPGDKYQPFVTIKLVGSITYKDVVTPFSLQTSVSQRLIDRQAL